jgi:hypothetical protein
LAAESSPRLKVVEKRRSSRRIHGEPKRHELQQWEKMGSCYAKPYGASVGAFCQSGEVLGHDAGTEVGKMAVVIKIRIFAGCV